MKKVKFFVKEFLTLNFYALHAIKMWKLKILYKDIENFKKKHTVNKNIQRNCKSIAKILEI